ncbi:MAG: CRISPR-associated helicase Cas3' [Conexivisphaera sp.]
MDHLAYVARTAGSFAAPAGNVAAKIAYISGALHDVGKYSSQFQEHVRGRRVRCSHHAPISALVAFRVVRRELGGAGGADVPVLLATDAVRSHHGGLEGLESLHSWARDLLEEVELEYDRGRCLLEQERSIRGNWGKIERELSSIEGLRVEESDLDVRSALEELKRVSWRAMKGEHSWSDYFLGLDVFSSLVDADKHGASGVEAMDARPQDPELIVEYARRLGGGDRMAPLRRALMERAMEWRWSPGKRVLGIISPTGSGKTLAGTLAALRRGRRRLIYALPYISIADQVHGVLSDALGEENVLKFHHLAFAQRAGGRRDGAEMEEVEERLVAVESWEHPVVVTTFEALVATLFSGDNSTLKRLHNLVGSVVVLDEVQAIPVEYWGLIREALENASSALDVDFVLMTATMPRLLAPDEILTPGGGIQPPSRFRITFMGGNREGVTPEELAGIVADSWDGRSSVMVELNTVASSVDVYRELTRRIGDRAELEYLSTHVVPRERRDRIEGIKRRLKAGSDGSPPVPLILVTTQVVEAGVDLDFDAVYRDLGPLDSVVQAAGRCNRNWRHEVGEVKVVKVRRRDRKSSDFSAVYGKVTEQLTEELLGARGWPHRDVTVGEEDVAGLLDEYYSKVEERRRPEDSSKYAEARRSALRLNYRDVRVSLIEEEPKNPVYIVLDGEARRILEELRSAMRAFRRADTIEERVRTRALVRKLRSAAEEYVVRVWEEPALQLDEALMLYVMDGRDVETKYDVKVGYLGSGGLIW